MKVRQGNIICFASDGQKMFFGQRIEMPKPCLGTGEKVYCASPYETLNATMAS